MADSQKYNNFQGDLKACVASYLGAAKTSGALILSSIASLVAAAPQRKRALQGPAAHAEAKAEVIQKWGTVVSFSFNSTTADECVVSSRFFFQGTGSVASPLDLTGRGAMHPQPPPSPACEIDTGDTTWIL